MVPIVNLLKKIDDKLKITWTKLTITQKCKNPNDIFACIKQLKAKHCRPENSPPQKKKKKKPSTRLVAFWGSGSPLSVKLHAVYLVLDQLIHRVRPTVLSTLGLFEFGCIGINVIYKTLIKPKLVAHFHSTPLALLKWKKLIGLKKKKIPKWHLKWFNFFSPSNIFYQLINGINYFNAISKC